MDGRTHAAVVALALFGADLGRAADTAAAAKPDPAAAKAAFEATAGEWKTLVGELHVLQAMYQQPKADKSAVEAKFDETMAKAQAVRQRLEGAALALIAVDPEHQRSRQVLGESLAEAMEQDDPARAVDLAGAMAAAGAADGNVLALAATASLLLSRIDDAEEWVTRASKAGLPAASTADLQKAIARDRPKVEAEMAKRKAEAQADDLPRVKISTSSGDLVVELFENEAPNTVANFLTLVEKGFYDSTPFHRVIGGFMAQGGDPTGSGSGGPGHAIACECSAPGARKHFLGTLSMAHAGKDTGGSQFFLTFRPTEHLDGKHTVFGRVIEGFDVLPRLTRTQDEQGRPVPGVKPDRIVKAEVVRKRNHPYDPKTLPDPRKR
jgi:cyclophilin family peptidyl-prolyl cis-trans isomerase